MLLIIMSVTLEWCHLDALRQPPTCLGLSVLETFVEVLVQTKYEEFLRSKTCSDKSSNIPWWGLHASLSQYPSLIQQTDLIVLFEWLYFDLVSSRLQWVAITEVRGQAVFPALFSRLLTHEIQFLWFREPWQRLDAKLGVAESSRNHGKCLEASLT